MNAQAFTTTTTIDGHPADVGEPVASEAAWTVDDVVRSVRTGGGTRHHARRWGIAVAAVAVAAAATVAAGLATDRAGATRAPVALPSRIAATTGNPGVAPMPLALASRNAAGGAIRNRPLPGRSRSVVVLMPGDGDHLAAASIPVAGIALGSPHGPRVRSVHVDLYVHGQRVVGTDFDVHSGRFAGVLRPKAAIDRGEAELRFSNPDNPAQAALIRPITLDVAPTTP